MTTCQLCGEEVAEAEGDFRGAPTHRECLLREVAGGIGHLLAHPYWCVQMHDPDAGLSRRVSALLVDEYVALVGVEAALARYPP